ncbi:hypothetical protein F3Y22_tig00112383pilonHSYRG00208 [Hibiscus syriacus]|uniref:Uncharacterized protein n=1 Tax=Hibiscus syriacus TaxID=106335 RepID=A0A6A2X0B8_HIBSY|nr:hypothetical protein F3Y22_tig00112383pilonHSYRG00208 [Hibiscus syriacus]
MRYELYGPAVKAVENAVSDGTGGEEREDEDEEDVKQSEDAEKEKEKERGRRKRTERARKWREWALIMRLDSERMGQRSIWTAGGGGVSVVLAEVGDDKDRIS